MPSTPDASSCPPPMTACTPAVLASGMRARDLVIDDRFVYFATEGYTARVAKTGGVVTKLDLHGASSLAIDGGELFMSTKDAILEIATGCDAEASRVFSTSARSPAAIAADATNVYVVDSFTLTFSKIRRTDGAATELLAFGHPVSVVAAPDAVFVSDWVEGITRIALDGTEVDKNLGGAASGFFAVSGSKIVSDSWSGVYYFDWQDKSAFANIADTTSAGDIVVDGTTVYFVDGAGVWRAPFAPKQAQLVASDVGAALLAVDDACVYYATNDRIVRTPK